MRNVVIYFSLCAALVLGLSQTARAQDAPRVAVDILPVQSLVAQVMQGVGLPDVLLAPGADPHHTTMRPSQAAALERADVVIVIGPRLTPWLERSLDRLVSDAELVTLLDVDGTALLEYRNAHDHGHGHGDDIDPHAWLDPANAEVWLSAIAETLGNVDPSRAALYRQNADKGRAALSDLDAELQTALQDMSSYGVHHDAFQYFEARFAVAPAFVIKEDDAHQPGPAQIAKLRTQIIEDGVACVFVEPLVNQGLVETVLEGSDAQILELDPMGVTIEPGPDHYAKVLRGMVSVMERCK